MENNEFLEEKKGNMVGAIVLGLVAAVVVAIILAAITIVREKQSGAMVLFAGFGVGYAVKVFAAKDSLKFGVIGALLSIFTCILGSAFCVIGLFGHVADTSYLDIVSKFGISGIMKLAFLDFGFMDIIFYGIAAYAGFAIGCNASDKQEEDTEKTETSDETSQED